MVRSARWMIALARRCAAAARRRVAAFALTRPEQVDGPDGARASRSEAPSDARGAGLRGRARPSSRPAAPTDTVIEQDPPAGAEAEEGSTVTLTVSLGLTVKVPDVAGDARGGGREADSRTSELLVDSRGAALARRRCRAG